MTRAVIPRRDRGVGLGVAAQLSVVDHEDVFAPCPESGALADEGRPENADVQEDGRRDGAVDVHLVIEPPAGLNFEEHGRKGDRDRRGREHDLAEEIQRLRPAARGNQPHVPHDELLGIEVDGADVKPPAAIVRVGDLTQELGVDVPRDQRSERPGVGERIAAQERDQDRSRSIRWRRCRASSSSCRTRAARRRTAARGTRTAPSARRSTRR